MALQLLFGKKYARTSVGLVVFDALLTENHEYNSRVTNYPVENGRIISDHIIKEPEIVNINGIVSDTPLNIFSAFNRSVNAFERLVEVYNRREPVTVITGIKIYTNMVMTNLSVPRNIQSGQSLNFSITLQKIFLDTSVRLTLDANNPFTRAPDKIPREIVAEANRYPAYANDPSTSFKDQASSQVNAGILNLLPVDNTLQPRLTGVISQIGARPR